MFSKSAIILLVTCLIAACDLGVEESNGEEPSPVFDEGNAEEDRLSPGFAATPEVPSEQDPEPVVVQTNEAQKKSENGTPEDAAVSTALEEPDVVPPDPCAEVACTDEDPCTYETCVEGTCVTSPAMLDGCSCDDENDCTEGDVYESRTCGGMWKTWATFIGNPGTQELGPSVVSVDGGYFVGATVTTPEKGADVAVYKLNPAGKLLWWKSFDSQWTPTPSSDVFMGIARVGGDAVVAIQTSFANDPTAVSARFLKLGAEGDLVWDTTFPVYTVSTIASTSDGGVAAGGAEGVFASDSSMQIYKLSEAGTVEWKSGVPEGLIYGSVVSMTETGSGDLIAVGTGKAMGAWSYYEDLVVARYGATGALKWFKVYGNECMNGVMGRHSVVETSDGGLAIAGYSCDGWIDVWLLRLDANGEMLWEQKNDWWGPKEIEGGHSFGMGIVASSSGEFVVVGYTKNPPGTQNGYPFQANKEYGLFQQYDAQGNLVSYSVSEPGYNDRFYDVLLAENDTVVVVGTSDLKLSSGVENVNLFVERVTLNDLVCAPGS